jgi:filamentous hemagglutinin
MTKSSKIWSGLARNYQNLPAGMEQQIIIDVRGQVITPDQENAIIQGIVQKSNGAIGPTSIQFKK